MRAKAKQPVGGLPAKEGGRSANASRTSNVALSDKGSVSSPKRDLLERILSLRGSIEAERGVLQDSYPLIRQGREE
jgi:hypothetical protein